MTETLLNSLFCPVKLNWSLAGTVVIGGQPLAGPSASPDVSGGGWWRASIQTSILFKTQIRQWRALAMRLNSGAAQIIVPVIDSNFCKPWPESISDGDHGVPHSDGTPFSDSSLYTSRLINYTLSGNISLRATSAILTRVVGGPLKGGEFFTLSGGTYGDRLYCVASVTDIDGENYTINFGPPAREAYTAGDFADFQNPRCTMKLSGQSLESLWPDMTLPPFQGQPSVTFEEYFS